MLHGSDRIQTNQQLVHEYFRRISESPTSTLELFTHDAIVYEPFSADKGLHGKEEIAYFLKVARMANQGFQKEIRISAASGNKNEIKAVVQFTKGDSITGKFQFKTADTQVKKGKTEKRIRELRIEFLK